MTTCEQNLTVLDICETVYSPIDYPDRPKEEGELMTPLRRSLPSHNKENSKSRGMDRIGSS